MKRLSIVLSILMFQAAVALPSFADDSSPGFYTQAAFAIQFQTDSVGNLGSSNELYGGSIALGYFLTDWLALQGRAQFIDSGADTMTYIYTAAAKLYVLNLLVDDPNGLIQPYAIGGIGGYTIDGGGLSTSNFTLELGAGLDLMFTDNLGVFGEFNYQFVDIQVQSANNIGMNIGVTYRF